MAQKPTEPRSAVGIKSMGWSMTPAIIINPAAEPRELLSWVFGELQDLYEWVDIMACSTCAFQIEPETIAGMVENRLKPLLQGMNAAFLNDFGRLDTDTEASTSGRD